MPPPDMLEQHVFGEEIVADEVSEGEFNVSPPKGSPETPDDSGMPSPPQEPKLPPPPPPPSIPPLPPSESGTLTPPLPPPPPRVPAPVARRPPSPLTSPIESSSDERSQDELPAVIDSKMAVKLSASDISDAELPSQSEKESSDDLEDLEKARAELQAKLAAAGMSDDASEETSEGEITSDVQIKQSEE